MQSTTMNATRLAANALCLSVASRGTNAEAPNRGGPRTMRLPTVRRLFAAIVAAAALLIAPTAMAQEYYTYISNNNIPTGDADDGAWINIDTAILTLSSCSNTITHEMWYETYQSGAYWVEVGVQSGQPSGLCFENILFWADNRPNGGGYHQHFYGNVGWSLNSWYGMSITTSGSCAWSVVFGGVTLGTSTSNCPGSGRTLAAGIEHIVNASATDSVAGYFTNWERLNSSDAWWNGWDNPWLGGTSGPGNYQPQIEWDTVPGEPPDTFTNEVLNEPF